MVLAKYEMGSQTAEKMNHQKQITLKLRVLAAEAESLAEDLDGNKLWDGDLQRRISFLFENLTAAQNYMNYK